MSSNDITPEEQELARQLSAWAHSLDDIPAMAKITRSGREGAGRALLESALGADAVAKIGRGRPSLSGTRGASQNRTVRFPADLDAELVARADAEHRKPSAVVRDAVAFYLHAQRAS